MPIVVPFQLTELYLLRTRDQLHPAVKGRFPPFSVETFTKPNFRCDYATSTDLEVRKVLRDTRLVYADGAGICHESVAVVAPKFPIIAIRKRGAGIENQE